jgi:hypothetical protein
LEVLELEVLGLEVLELEVLEWETLEIHHEVEDWAEIRFADADADAAKPDEGLARTRARTRSAAPPTRGATAPNHSEPAITSHRRDAIPTGRPRRARPCLCLCTCTCTVGGHRR